MVEAANMHFIAATRAISYACEVGEFFIPVSASTWWAGVRKGYYPKPVKLGPKMTAWRAEDIHEFFKTGVKF